MPDTYVVIYDKNPGLIGESEEYYGYFSSPEQAESVYRDMIRGDEGSYGNARICKVVGLIDNCNTGQDHTPNEHGQCDDCRGWVGADNKPVAVTLEEGDQITVIARFDTVSEAEDYLATSAAIDPDLLEAGNYGVDAPEEMINHA